MIGYDQQYQKVDAVFGSVPEKILVEFADKIPPKFPVLDLGAGQGRNSFFLAHKNFKVDAVDPSSVAIDFIKDQATRQAWPLIAYQSDFETFPATNGPYSAVLVFGLLQILDWSTIHLLIQKLEQWTFPGSLLFVTAFSTFDDSFAKFEARWSKSGKNSFSDAQGNIRTFFEPEEILEIFDRYSALHHEEYVGPEHHHGNGIVERHHLIEAVFKVL